MYSSCMEFPFKNNDIGLEVCFQSNMQHSYIPKCVTFFFFHLTIFGQKKKKKKSKTTLILCVFLRTKISVYGLHLT